MPAHSGHGSLSLGSTHPVLAMADVAKHGVPHKAGSIARSVYYTLSVMWFALPEPGHASVGCTILRRLPGLFTAGAFQVGGSAVLGLSLRRPAAAAQEAGATLPAVRRPCSCCGSGADRLHLDTFDPKPERPVEYRGPFGSIATSVPGVRFASCFPDWLEQDDRFALVRSLHTGSNDHGVAGTIGLTGSARRRRRARRQAVAGRAAAGDRQRRGPLRGGFCAAAAFHRRRRPAAPGQKADRRRGRRRARRHVTIPSASSTTPSRARRIPVAAAAAATSRPSASGTPASCSNVFGQPRAPDRPAPCRRAHRRLPRPGLRAC